MTSPAWMPFYPADYLSKTRHLSAAQHGAYMLLIMSYWDRGGLPDDDSVLARLSAMSEKEWKANRSVISEFFQPGWKHARIDQELAKAADKSAARAAAGARGGAAKANNALANATELVPQKPDKNVANDLASSSQPTTQTSAAAVTASPRDRLAIVPDSNSREWQLDLELKCREAAGLENDPASGLLQIGPIFDLKEAGWSLEWHILPALRKAKADRKRGKTWAYYVPIITNGADAPPKAKPPPKDQTENLDQSPQAAKERVIAKMAERDGWASKLLQFKKTGNWSEQWGAPPGQPGCPILPEFIEKFERQLANGAH